MTFNPVAIAPLLFATSLPLVASSMLPATSVQLTANPWQPIARIDPQKPYKIQLVNQTGLEVEYASTTNEFSPRKLAPRQSTVLTRLPLPLYLLISPVNPQYNVKNTVAAKQNLVTITIQPIPEGQPGNNTINLQTTGGIYVY